VSCIIPTNPPWFAAFPRVILQSQFPSYIAPDLTFFRPEAGALFLQSKPRFSVNDVLSAKESTHMLFADRVLPDLIAAAHEFGDQTARDAANVLDSWTKNSDAADTGAILFQLWYQLYVSDPNSPRSTSWGSQYPAFRVEWSDASPLDRYSNRLRGSETQRWLFERSRNSTGEAVWPLRFALGCPQWSRLGRS
jgi:acyl-homoserine-lactone acylase